MNTSDLIQPRHLTRRAVIYVRQSSPHQVRHNTESARLQHAMTNRARELGWHEADVEVVGDDTGHSATTTAGRIGFQKLAAEVGLGEIGVIVAYDATRLARNCTDWYQLLDLCGRTACLIADRDGVYDPSSINGRLLLGLKGAISELESHTLRGRLIAGILSKAQRGELAQQLPTGLVRLDSGEVAKHPDLAVQQRIALVFETLLEKKSVNGVVRHFHRHGLKVPRRDQFGDIQWKPVSMSSICEMAKNPAYAGAFAYGRTKGRIIESTGKRVQSPLPREQWQICVRDKYPAYISWGIFEKIESMLHDNYAEYQSRNSRGAPRDGKALLQGIAYCGECGHKLCMRYKQGIQYRCDALWVQYGEPHCQRFPADRIDEQVVSWFFEAISMAEIDLSVSALEEADRTRDKLLATRKQEVERLRYQARLAERQFNHSDPENRLVTAELERRWEKALRECNEAEKQLREEEAHTPCLAIPADLLEQLKDVGPHVSELWEQNLLRSSQKKALLRTLIDKVVLHRVAPDQVRTRVVWRGGMTTTADLPVMVASFARLSGAKETEEAILRLAREGQRDEQIAATLTAQGHRSPLSDKLLPDTVNKIRLAHHVYHSPNHSHPCRVPGYLTITQLAEILDRPQKWFHGQISRGAIRVKKDEAAKCYVFPDEPSTLEKFRQFIEGQISELDFLGA
jgi:DNA invertase Pin-like site-specific DNA recombinase